MTDEETSIRGYLAAQGAKLSQAEIVDKVSAAMDHLRTAAQAIPDAPSASGRRSRSGVPTR